MVHEIEQVGMEWVAVQDARFQATCFLGRARRVVSLDMAPIALRIGTRHRFTYHRWPQITEEPALDHFEHLIITDRLAFGVNTADEVIEIGQQTFGAKCLTLAGLER